MRMSVLSLACSLLPYAFGMAVLCAAPMAGGAHKRCPERIAQATVCDEAMGRGCVMRLY